MAENLPKKAKLDDNFVSSEEEEPRLYNVERVSETRNRKFGMEEVKFRAKFTDHLEGQKLTDISDALYDMFDEILENISQEEYSDQDKVRIAISHAGLQVSSYQGVDAIRMHLRLKASAFTFKSKNWNPATFVAAFKCILIAFVFTIAFDSDYCIFIRNFRRSFFSFKISCGELGESTSDDKEMPKLVKLENGRKKKPPVSEQINETAIYYNSAAY